MDMNICYNCFKEKKNNSICPHCGYSAEQDIGKYPLALNHGTVLGGKYIIGRVLGQGGFGITYVAQDYKTKELVAIKEYFPDALATRSNTHSVSFSSRDREEGFQYGKECFLDEAKTLAEFIGNPNIVRVYSYFEENNTAYFAMEYIEGISLKIYLNNNGGKISFEEAQRILAPVMDALSAVHAKGIIHRDISPDNIFITKDGTVKLIDFGAARYSLGDKSRSLDVILKHGYAPKEQYTRRGRQGPYTDVYSFAATFYKAITGHIPPDSIDRIEEDSLVLPSALGCSISPEAEDALFKGLEVMVGDRFQTMQEFKAALISAEKPIPVIIEDEDDIKEEKNEEEKPKEEAEENNEEPKEDNKEEEEKEEIEKEEDKEEKNKTNLKKILPKAIPCAAAVLVAAFIFSFVIGPNIFSESVSSNKTTEPSASAKNNIVESHEVDEDIESYSEIDDFIEDSSEVEPTVNNSSKNEVSKQESKSSQSSSADNSSSQTSSDKTSSAQSSSSKTTSSDSSKVTSSNSSSSKTSSSKSSSSKTTSSQSSSSKTTSSQSSSANSTEKYFKTAAYGNGVKITGYTGSEKNLTIPSKIGGKSVVAIGESAFEYNKITSVTIPNSVTVIESLAFDSCSSLTSISIPNSVTKIGYDAFYDCKSLKSITIPNGVTEIEAALFSGCSSLTSISIPNSVTKIGNYAFYNCTGLANITIPNSVTYIGYSAFEGCTNFKSVTIPDSVSEIAWGAFANCTNLEKISIPKNCELSEFYTFQGCNKVVIERR